MSQKNSYFGTAILRCIAERDNLMRVSSHMSQAVHEINKTAFQLGLDLESGSRMVSTTSLSWKEVHAARKLTEEC